MTADSAGAGPLSPGASLKARISAVVPGVMLAITLAMAARFVSEHLGGPVMLYALLFGIAFNFLATERSCQAGIGFSAKSILRLGVALLGVRITVGEVADLGAPVVVLVVAGVAFTLIVGALVGRLFRLSMDHAVLSAGAVAICGASAALAISAVLPQHKLSERNTSLTVVGVTTLSTVAMVLYPILSQALGFDDVVAGTFIGATIHDVAQVVGAGYIISDTAGETAAIVKLMRVACLVPAVVIIGLIFRSQTQAGETAKRPPLLPLFLIGFVALTILNSFGVFPAAVATALSDASRWCLVIAVAALGVKTSLKDIFSVGPNPVAVLVLQTVLLALFALAGLLALQRFTG